MSTDPDTALAALRFYTTPAHACSYLADRQAVTLFADPGAKIDTRTYTTLSAHGFRRSGAHIYRPHCQACKACIPVRVLVSQARYDRRQKRIWNRNQDLSVTSLPPQATDEYFDLFARYIAARHADGDMYPADRQQFQSFLVQGRTEARFIEFRLEGKLLAVSVIDELDDALSAVYTFFEPREARRSLGTHVVLWLLQETGRQQKPWLYLGYWIRQCQKMSYKTDYQPIEGYINDRWVSLPPDRV